MISCFHLYALPYRKVKHVYVPVILALNDPIIDLRGDSYQALRRIDVELETGNILLSTSYLVFLRVFKSLRGLRETFGVIVVIRYTYKSWM
jgi:hypothetical protein